MSGIDDGHHPQLIIGQIERAEALLSDIVGTHILREGDGESWVPDDLVEAMAPLRSAEVRAAVIEHPLLRLNASWSYLDLVAWEPLISRADTPILFQLCRNLGKADKKHQVIAEEHNLSGVHFHYARLDGARSNILFAFGSTPNDPDNPVTWERHGAGRFKPKPDEWNRKKRLNINLVCGKVRGDLAPGTRWFTPSKEALFLLPM